MEEKKEFQEFCSLMEEAVRRRFPKEVTVEIRRILKNNSLELDSLVILQKRETISPNFYLQLYYGEYQRGKTVDALAEQIEESYYQALESEENLELDLSYISCAGKIIFRLVSYERNAELLQKVPYKRFLDMAVTFHILLRKDAEGIGSVRITNSLLALWDLDVEALFLLARENTERIFPKQMCSMFSMMEQIFNLDDRNKPEQDDIAEEVWCETFFGGWEEIRSIGTADEPYVVTNSNGINGAAVILYPNTLKEIGEAFGEDYYLLPSSIHEWLVISASASMGVEEMREMVQEVNTSCVAKEEILSDAVYYYQYHADKLAICSKLSRI